MPSDLLITRGGFNITAGRIEAIQELGVLDAETKALASQREAWREALSRSVARELETPDGMLRYVKTIDGSAAITGYLGHAPLVTVPKQCDGGTVKAILDGAFSCNTAIREVRLPDGVEYISSGAFRASGLIRFRAPSSLRFLAHDAFGSCQSIEQLELPLALQCIEFGCFRLAGGPPNLTFTSPRRRIKVRYARNAAGISAFRLLHFENGVPLEGILAEADETLLTVYNPGQRVLGLMERLNDPVLLTERMRQAMLRNLRSAFAPAALSFARRGQLAQLDALMGCEFLESPDLADLVSKLSAAGEVAALNLVLEHMRCNPGARSLDFEV